MMGGPRMMGSAPSAATSDQLSILRALARLLDPESGPQIERLAASLPREDVARALTGLHELLATITALSPIEGAIAEAIADLEEREARLAAREGVLRRREGAISHALANLETTL
jgi:hypothetical protein